MMMFKIFAVVIVLFICSFSSSWFTPISYRRKIDPSTHIVKSATYPAWMNAPANMPPELLSYSTIYDMVLVERISAPERTTGGLFLPKVEGKDQKHLGVVLSVPKSFSHESNNFNVESVVPFDIGDVVFIRDPWGVGPMHIELENRCFSFHKAEHITGVLQPNNM